MNVSLRTLFIRPLSVWEQKIRTKTKDHLSMNNNLEASRSVFHLLMRAGFSQQPKALMKRSKVLCQ